ncbi:hypothetical protein [Kineosporia succinea]|uniref:Uncharacterized protein n=1 Tax=Kineosporia succinea TaxID=84632 RepID=A0ABT9P935_9ACTN|nr:hypothetical protein [Kineosporia succinea]MDP9829204.1 hypothetical protein [Kineosporia succinea]
MSYLTALAVRRGGGEDGDRQLLALLTDLQNTVAARQQTDVFLRRLQEDVVAGEVDRSTQGRLQRALDDGFGGDPDFGRRVTDLLNRIEAMDARRETSLLTETARSLKGSPGLEGAIRARGDYARSASGLLAPALIAGGVAVVVVAGAVIIIRPGDATPRPETTSAASPARSSTSPAAVGSGAAPQYGESVAFRSPDGFTYQIRATGLEQTTERQGDSAAPGTSFLALTISERNLSVDRMAPGQLADKYGAGAVAVSFPSTAVSPASTASDERSCSVAGASEPGYLVQEDAARGRPVGSCMYQLSWVPELSQASTRLSADGDPYTEIPAGGSNALRMLSTAAFNESIESAAASVYVTFAESEDWITVPEP